MQRALKWFERAIGVVVIALVSVIVLLTAIELVWVLVRAVITPPVLLLGIDDVLGLLGMVLLLVVGLELLETMGRYLSGGDVRVDTILMAAMVALARKIIVLDITHLSVLTPLALGALVLALAIAYRLCRTDT